MAIQKEGRYALKVKVSGRSVCPTQPFAKSICIPLSFDFDFGSLALPINGCPRMVIVEDRGKVATSSAALLRVGSACKEDEGVEGGVSNSSDDDDDDDESMPEKVSETREGVRDTVRRDSDTFHSGKARDADACRGEGAGSD